MTTDDCFIGLADNLIAHLVGTIGVHHVLSEANLFLTFEAQHMN